MSLSESIKLSETHRHAPPEVKEIMEAVADCSVGGSLEVRQIICRCPPHESHCDCDDLLINRRNR